MKVSHRNGLSRGSTPRKTIDFISLDKESYITRRDSIPVQKISAMHYAKRQTCPNMYLGGGINQIHFVNDQSTVARNSNTGVSDSRRENQLKEDWKILTLKEIKTIRDRQGPGIFAQSHRESQVKTGRKLFVSISKSNRESVSRQKKGKSELRLSQVGGQHQLLKNLSNRRQIVETVEMQLQQTVAINKFFCG